MARLYKSKSAWAQSLASVSEMNDDVTAWVSISQNPIKSPKKDISILWKVMCTILKV